MSKKIVNFRNLWFTFLLLYTHGFLFSQQSDFINFKEGNINVKINPFQQALEGAVSYSFEIEKEIDSVFLNARDLHLFHVSLNGSTIKYSYDDQKITIYKKFTAGERHTIKLKYKAKPKKAMYFIGWDMPDAKKQVWTQGQGKHNSHWVPCIEDVNEKIIFNLTITFPEEFQVISNGILTEEIGIQDSLKTWRFSMKKPMSSYLLAIAAGNYSSKTLVSKSGTPIELYYYKEDSLKFEPTYRYTQRIFDFFEEKIGYNYPWDIYKQIPVKDFLYAGMENTSATIFSDAHVIDSTSFIDKNYVNVNAHEMAHQWFGNLVTAKSSTHHWLQEGFATYYALLAEKMIFGEDYFYHKLYRSGRELMSLSDDSKGESLLNPKASSLTFYEKGAWVLHMLANEVGEQAFDISVKKYLQKHQFSSAETDDFLRIVEEVSGKKLTKFKKIWLENAEIPKIQARFDADKVSITSNGDQQFIDVKYIVNTTDTITRKTSESFEVFGTNRYRSKLSDRINSLLLNYDYQSLLDIEFDRPLYLLKDQIFNAGNLAVALEGLEDYHQSHDSISAYRAIVQQPYPHQLKEYAIYQLFNHPEALRTQTILDILASGDLKNRQAVALYINRIPEQLRSAFETLLEDKSYVTIEKALMKLWINFPEKRKDYLEKTKNIQGFNNKNVRVLWIALALITEDYYPQETPVFYKELSGYTDQYYHFEIRQNAFTYLYQLQMLSDKNLKDLILAGTHPVWQFASFSRDLMDVLLKDTDYKNRIETILTGFTSDQSDWVRKRIAVNN
ncbi:M1 family metallopeptidase [Flavobacteriaceae bacterium M23B6Z8]